MIEHEVLPAYSTRFALTFWSSGESTLSQRPLSSIPPQITSKYDDNHNRRNKNREVASEIMKIVRKQVDETLSNGQNMFVENALLEPMTSRRNKKRGHSDEEKIFVCIASYRDSELKRTVVDLFVKAQYPQNIFVGEYHVCCML